MGELLDRYHERSAPLPGDAAEIPTEFHLWIALTFARLLFFEGGLFARVASRLAPEGSPGRLHSEIRLAEVLAIAPIDSPDDERLELRFADNTQARIVCAYAGEGTAFRAAFEEARRAR